ncbi:DUF6040 family protein [Lachnospiraceae bacterium KK002]
MNLKDRRQSEMKPPDMSENLQTDESKKTQSWNDTTEKYRMLLADQSETIRTQKNTISEQEKIIRQQVSDIREQNRKISELRSNLEQVRADMAETESNLREQHESRLSEKDSQILQAQNLAQEWKKKAEKAELDLKQMEQNHSSQISRLKSEIQNLSDKIVKLNGADLVLKENEKLKKQNGELQKSERKAREEAEKEVAHVKSEYYQKEQELDRLIEDAEQEKQKAISVQSVVQKLTDQKANRLTEDTRRQLQIWYQTKKAAMQGYVGVLTMICFVTTILSVIRQRVFCGDAIQFFKGFGKVIQIFAVHMHATILSIAEVTERVPNNVAAVILKWGMVVLLWIMPAALIGFGIYKFWEKYGEDIRKGIDVWNCSVAVLILAWLVYFGDYVKELVSVNLFGIWLLVDVLLVLIGWYVWGCKKHRGLC